VGVDRTVKVDAGMAMFMVVALEEVAQEASNIPRLR